MNIVQKFNPPEMIVAVPAFDYSSLDAETAQQFRAVAARVRGLQQRQISTIIETGRELLSAKARLGHGAFGNWIEAEFSWAERTAQNYMRAAAEFGDKSATIAVLQPTTVYELAAPSTPASIRDEVVKRIEAGEQLDHSTVKHLVRAARQEAKKADALAKLTPDQQKKRIAKEKRQRRSREQREAQEREWQRQRVEEDKAKFSAGQQALQMLHRRFAPNEMKRLAELARSTGPGFVHLLASSAGLELEPYEAWWIERASRPSETCEAERVEEGSSLSR